jgi:hypothetical protein
MSTDLTFITNESGKSLRDRFGVLLGDDTRLFDCLVGYFFISGYYVTADSTIKLRTDFRDRASVLTLICFSTSEFPTLFSLALFQRET